MGPVAVVASHPERRESVADAIDGEWPVETLAPGDSPGDDCSCLVVAEDPTSADAVRTTVGATLAPVVVFADADPVTVCDEVDADGFVRDDGRSGTVTRLVDEVALRIVDQSDTVTALRETNAKIERLHDVAVELAACDTSAAVGQVTARVAEEVLDLDLVGLYSARDGHFVPVAVSDAMADAGDVPADGSATDEGIAGETFQSGDSVVVEDVSTLEDDGPGDDHEYRSVLSVPVGDFGVLVAWSCQVDAFDERDRELTELLATHVAQTVERLQAESDLRRERDRLSALFENVPDPAVRFAYADGALRVQEVNPEFESVFGWSNETLVGEDIDEYIVPEGFEDEAAALNEKLVAGESLNVVSRRTTRDGIRDFLLHVVPFERGERSLQGYAIYTDITEEKQRQRELERQNERLDAFASIVSHDLRNPLSIAEGYVNLAEDSGDERYFEEIRYAHERMNTLVDDLLTLARQGDVVGDPEPVDIGAVATQAWAGVQTGDAELSVVDDVTVDADRARVVELLENLFRNAVTHGTSDDVPGRRTEGSPLTVTVDRLPGAAGFSVADDGRGVPAEDRERILESGYTTSNSGTGLGLSIVQEIADAHGWTVTVGESDEGGVEFRFETAADVETG
ncbi:ATP-binding protein [Haloarchaeobius sp. HRN-SO-5]|uniref:ATP-binding protein n=1 Tax=Haloarchaeobius sp. HRN-SO-5 TaxID=3446118 RepID=UPI003EB9A253